MVMMTSMSVRMLGMRTRGMQARGSLGLCKWPALAGWSNLCVTFLRLTAD